MDTGLDLCELVDFWMTLGATADERPGRLRVATPRKRYWVWS
jgi:hypothetical protein